MVAVAACSAAYNWSVWRTKALVNPSSHQPPAATTGGGGGGGGGDFTRAQTTFVSEVVARLVSLLLSGFKYAVLNGLIPYVRNGALPLVATRNAVSQLTKLWKVMQSFY